MGIEKKYTGFDGLVTVTTQITTAQAQMLQQVSDDLHKKNKNVSVAKLHRAALELLKERILKNPDFLLNL